LGFNIEGRMTLESKGSDFLVENKVFSGKGRSKKVQRGVDRRRHLRYEINLPVFIFDLGLGKRAAAHTLDVRLGGMKIYAEKGLPSGRKILFQLVLKRKSIWVKGRVIFRQTDPELVNFFCISFEETSKESNFGLQGFLSHLEALWQKGQIEMMVQNREREAALVNANELPKGETQGWERREQIIKEIGERLENLSLEFVDLELKLKTTVQGLNDRIEAMLLAIYYGLRNIRILLKEGSVSDEISFEQIIMDIQNNYKGIRKILDNLHDFIQ
jgi:hypothetical protein